MARYVYRFAQGMADGTATMHELLGAKGAGLAEMARLGLPVPAGFTVSTEACARYLEQRQMPQELYAEVKEGLAHIQSYTARAWKDAKNPLLVSIRVGGPAALPGMSQTILNIGLDQVAARALVKAGDDEEFVRRARGQFHHLYRQVVYGGIELPIPDDPEDQLWEAIKACFASWEAPQMQGYRRLHDQSTGPGTAVTVMAMVFGDRDDQSASGVCFTRHPATGQDRLYGEYLPRRQGIDVVAAAASPHPLCPDDRLSASEPCLAEAMPAIFEQLKAAARQLESHYREMQEIEFTIESGRLWLLQSRRATRTGPAAVKVTLDMLDEELIDDEEAVLKVDPIHHVPELSTPRIDPALDDEEPLFEGIASSPGAATGRLVIGVAEAVSMARRGEPVVLLRRMTSADDVEGIEAADALVTTEGGLTAHAAEVAREISLPCVSGARQVHLAEDASGIYVGDHFFARGAMLTVDGSTGRVYEGSRPLITDRTHGDERYAQFFDFVDRHRRMDIRLDITSMDQVGRQMDLSVDGVGMAHLDRLLLNDDQQTMAMRQVLLSADEESVDQAMGQLLQRQRHDAVQILRAARGLPVSFALMDAPLQEFLPQSQASRELTASTLDLDPDALIRQIHALRESHPLLGLRGSRLAIVQPSLYAMQIQAVVEATRAVVDEGITPLVGLLLPRIADPGELSRLVGEVQETVGRHLHGTRERLRIDVGASIHLPRAAMMADEIAKEVDYLLVATGDLTALTWGMTPENSPRFMTTYLADRLVAHDPFQSLDRPGVGELLRMTISRGRHANPDLIVGVDAAHGADPRSIRFFESIDVDFLTVHPDDVQATRLAAAQAYVRYERALRFARPPA